jgi:hypothetical protein
MLSDATSISSGSAAFTFDKGARTTLGAEEPAVETPPSKLTVCAREYFPSVKI